MEKVAKAGGWEEHHQENLAMELELKKKEQEILTQLGKYSEEQWKSIKESLSSLGSFVSNPAEDAITMFASGIKDEFTSEVGYLLSPIKNELNSMLNEFLEPFMPLIQQVFELVRPIMKWLTDTLKPLIDGITLNLGNALRILQEGFDTEGLVEITKGPWAMTGDPLHDLGVVHAHYLEWASWSPEYNFWDPLGSYERFLAWVREKYGDKNGTVGGYDIEEYLLRRKR
jgi:hypothetical protein